VAVVQVLQVELLELLVQVAVVQELTPKQLEQMELPIQAAAAALVAMELAQAQAVMAVQELLFCVIQTLEQLLLVQV
jgi:hypothetical protein